MRWRRARIQDSFQRCLSSLLFSFLFFSFSLSIFVFLSRTPVVYKHFICSFVLVFFRPKLEELESFYRSIDRNVVAKKEKKSTKGQTLSSSIQRRHGKSCKMKTLCYFFKNSGIDSVLCHIFFFSSAIGSLSISLYVSLFVTRCDFMFVSETQFAHYLAHSKKEKFTKGKKNKKKTEGVDLVSGRPGFHTPTASSRGFHVCVFA